MQDFKEEKKYCFLSERADNGEWSDVNSES